MATEVTATFEGGPLHGRVMQVATTVVDAIDDSMRSWQYVRPESPGPWIGRPTTSADYYVRPPSPPPLPRAFRIANRLLRPLGLMLLPGDGT